jgi:uncharacterized protein YjbI with pentapeptide repeats
MTLRPLLLSLLAATCLSGVAHAGDEPHRRLVIGGDCAGCTFQDGNLAGAQFLGGDFSEANFRNAELLGARLIDLNLQNADFRDASLIEARLANVGLEGANLREARLDRGRLHRVRMIDADLHESSLDEAVLLLVDLSGANLTNASAAQAVFRQSRLTDAEIRNTDFDGAHFSGSSLTNIDARSASFNGTIFENVDLSGANLRDTQLSEARFVAANITGADFRGAEGLFAYSFTHVCGSDVRGLPDDVRLVDCSALAMNIQTERVAAARASGETMMLRQREARRAQIEQARIAFEAAMTGVEGSVMFTERQTAEAIEAALEGLHAAAENGDATSRAAIESAREGMLAAAATRQAQSETALAAAREGLRAAAQALAGADLEVDFQPDGESWTFEIRRAELGEPIRVILEQANPERMVMIAPPPPPSPPAPKLPEPDPESGLAGAPEAPAAPEFPADVEVSAADIAFLIDASAQDFFEEMSPAPTAFRNVQAGVMRVEGAADRPILCGEAEVMIDGEGPQWASFATIRTASYQTWIGAAASAACDDERTQKQPSADLAIRLEQRLSDLSGQ